MNAAEGLRTQISGKYSQDNLGIFTLRQHLIDLGVTVAFPAGNDIIKYTDGFAITTPEEAETPFVATELAFLRAIDRSDFHIVYDIWDAEDGYVGESTAIETIYAVAHNVPTVWLRQPVRLSPALSPHAAHFTRDIMRHAWVEPLDRLTDDQLVASIGRLAARQTGVRANGDLPRPQFTGTHYILEHNRYYFPLWDDYREELFVDVKGALFKQYQGAWEQYRANVGEVVTNPDM